VDNDDFDKKFSLAKTVERYWVHDFKSRKII
jgi:hypothetical protein